MSRADIPTAWTPEFVGTAWSPVRYVKGSKEFHHFTSEQRAACAVMCGELNRREAEREGRAV